MTSEKGYRVLLDKLVQHHFVNMLQEMYTRNINFSKIQEGEAGTNQIGVKHKSSVEWISTHWIIRSNPYYCPEDV